MKIQQVVTLGVRSDSAGDGAFGSPRSKMKDGMLVKYTHCGIDLECFPVDPILSPINGKVTKLGYPYASDLSWRYIQVTDMDGMDHRFFYVNPTVYLGTQVFEGTTLGVAQDITERYPDRGMKPHIHYEIKDKGGAFIDPGIS